MGFFTITEAGKTIYINIAHIVKAESDAAGKTITVRLIDGSAHVVTGDERIKLIVTLSQ